jgi:hypothetical protein
VQIKIVFPQRRKSDDAMLDAFLDLRDKLHFREAQKAGLGVVHVPDMCPGERNDLEPEGHDPAWVVAGDLDAVIDWLRGSCPATWTPLSTGSAACRS